jgi:hypothetical protein
MDKFKEYLRKIYPSLDEQTLNYIVICIVKIMSKFIDVKLNLINKK